MALRDRVKLWTCFLVASLPKRPPARAKLRSAPVFLELLSTTLHVGGPAFSRAPCAPHVNVPFGFGSCSLWSRACFRPPFIYSPQPKKVVPYFFPRRRLNSDGGGGAQRRPLRHRHHHHYSRASEVDPLRPIASSLRRSAAVVSGTPRWSQTRPWLRLRFPQFLGHFSSWYLVPPVQVQASPESVPLPEGGLRLR